mmetsp:Transcript_45205/g.126009  ORF Transcript_45205/g.126009 Transcript_45205/m.126009 type:complete len:292 (+) Transcript_45205:295-1170(+)
MPASSGPAAPGPPSRPEARGVPRGVPRGSTHALTAREETGLEPAPIGARSQSPRLLAEDGLLRGPEDMAISWRCVMARRSCSSSTSTCSRYWSAIIRCSSSSAWRRRCDALARPSSRPFSPASCCSASSCRRCVSSPWCRSPSVPGRGAAQATSAVWVAPSACACRGGGGAGRSWASASCLLRCEMSSACLSHLDVIAASSSRNRTTCPPSSSEPPGAGLPQSSAPFVAALGIDSARGQGRRFPGFALGGIALPSAAPSESSVRAPRRARSSSMAATWRRRARGRGPAPAA